MRVRQAEQLCAERISSVLAQFVDEQSVPGVLGVVTDTDHTVYTGAFGAARRREAVAVAPDTVYRIASMTKPLTSAAVMLLVDDGAVELDAPLSRYVPGYRQPDVLVSFDAPTCEYVTRPAKSELTVRQLLSHTSGYGYWFLDEPLLLALDGPPDLLNAPFLMADPGRQFRYSTSTDVVAQLIQPVSGRPFGEFLAQRLLRPLGMRDTGYEPPASSDRLASVFVRDEHGFSELEPETQGQPPRGGGGLYSTAEDYCRFMRMILNRGAVAGKQLLSRGAVAEMIRNQIGDLSAQVQTTAFPQRTNDFIFMNGTQKFGLGFALESRDQPRGRPSGSASWAGIYNTYFWIDFDNAFAAAIFMQVQPFADTWCVAARRAFEQTLYDCLHS